MAGLFVTFEGIEHCGKTTQSEALAASLRADGHDVVLTREPGGTPLGQSIRELLLHDDQVDIDAVAELLLFAVDRAQHVNRVIRPALKAGKIVISDRFFDSTRAYQGIGRQIDATVIDNANSLATSGLSPDLTILMDIDIPTSRARGDDKNDRIEQDSNLFFDRVRMGFLKLAEDEPNRFVVVDGTRKISDVSQEIKILVDSRLAAC